MKYKPALIYCIMLLSAMSSMAANDANAWGQLMYTHYLSSKIYFAPMTISAVQGELGPNETVRAEFKSGKWYAIFKPSEKVRSIKNAIGYMEEEDLFSDPLPTHSLAEGEVIPPVAFSIEKMRPLPSPRVGSSSASETSYHSPAQPSNYSPPPVSSSHSSQSQASYEPLSSISWSEIDTIYGLSSKLTDLQKDEVWKKYQGKRVQWSGEVVDISQGFFGGLSLSIRMNRSTFTYDLSISLKSDQRDRALRYKVGDRVTFKGTLRSWGTLLPITLDNGEVS